MIKDYVWVRKLGVILASAYRLSSIYTLGELPDRYGVSRLSDGPFLNFYLRELWDLYLSIKSNVRHTKHGSDFTRSYFSSGNWTINKLSSLRMNRAQLVTRLLNLYTFILHYIFIFALKYINCVSIEIEFNYREKIHNDVLNQKSDSIFR